MRCSIVNETNWSHKFSAEGPSWPETETAWPRAHRVQTKPRECSQGGTGTQIQRLAGNEPSSSQETKSVSGVMCGVTVWPLSSCQCDSGGICHDVTKTRMDLEQFSAPSPLIVCACWGETSCPVFRRDNHQMLLVMTCLLSNYQR